MDYPPQNGFSIETSNFEDKRAETNGFKFYNMQGHAFYL